MLRKLNSSTGTSLAVQWLSLCAFTVGGAGLITGWGTKIPHAIQWSQKKKPTILLHCWWECKKWCGYCGKQLGSSSKS